jgi:hypothetical protein
VPDFSGAQIVFLLFVLLLLAAIPVWTHPLPPLEDYINHLARMHVIATIERDANLSRFYEVDWQIIPNLMMDLVVPVLGRVVGIYRAGQIFTVACFLSIISGMLVLNRRLFGRWSPAPLIAVPLLYNYVFLVGVLNYLFGIGFSLWALATWIWLRRRAWPLRLAVSALFASALFLCHLFAFGLFGLSVLAYETWLCWCRRDESLRVRIVELLASGSPFLIVLPLLLSSPTLRLATNMDWEPRGKLDGLIYIIEVYSDVTALIIAATLTTACAWAARRRVLRVHPFGWALLVIGGAVYLAMPRVLFASYMADQRLPVAIAFILIAAIDLRLLNRQVRRGFIAIVLTLLAMRVTEVDVAWAQLSATTREFRQSVRRIKVGAKVLVAYAERSGGDDVRDFNLVHAACLAMIERSALVTTAFTVPGKHILHPRPEFQDFVDTEDGTPPSVGELVIAGKQTTGDNEADYWRNWRGKFDYLYVLFTDDNAPNPDPQHLTLIYEGDQFQLYSVNKPK